MANVERVTQVPWIVDLSGRRGIDADSYIRVMGIIEEADEYGHLPPPKTIEEEKQESLDAWRVSVRKPRMRQLK